MGEGEDSGKSVAAVLCDRLANALQTEKHAAAH